MYLICFYPVFLRFSSSLFMLFSKNTWSLHVCCDKNALYTCTCMQLNIFKTVLLIIFKGLVYVLYSNCANRGTMRNNGSCICRRLVGNVDAIRILAITLPSCMLICKGAQVCLLCSGAYMQTYIHVYWPDGEEKRLPKGITRDPYDVLHSCWAVELQVCAVSVGERSLPPTLVSGVD